MSSNDFRSTVCGGNSARYLNGFQRVCRKSISCMALLKFIISNDLINTSATIFKTKTNNESSSWHSFCQREMSESSESTNNNDYICTIENSLAFIVWISCLFPLVRWWFRMSFVMNHRYFRFESLFIQPNEMNKMLYWTFGGGLFVNA